MKVYLIINTHDAWSDELYYKTDLFIASTYEKAKEYTSKYYLDEKSIREIQVDGESISLCSDNMIISENSTSNEIPSIIQEKLCKSDKKHLRNLDEKSSDCFIKK